MRLLTFERAAARQFLVRDSRSLVIPDAQGYEFSWGYVQERRINHYVLFDFCCSALLLHTEQAGKPLEDCQRQVFKVLEQQFDCTTRDLYTIIGTSQWQLCYSSSMSMFSQIVHFVEEQAAREWVVSQLLPVLPDIIAKVKLQLT